MPRTRDRHGRGIRGPLALPHPWSSRPVPLRRPDRNEFFNQCMREAISDIAEFNPQALSGVRVGVEDVPHFNTAWSGHRVPLAAALEPTDGRGATVVVYQRPLERRATTRSQLRRLVHRTICEQLSALTGMALHELADDHLWDDED